MNRFLIYQEYGAKYDMMLQDEASIKSTIPSWDVHQRGIEILSKVLTPQTDTKIQSKRASTVKDLLIKV